MRLLLDTHIIVWMATDDSRLPHRVRDRLLDAELYVSAISGWEYGVKRLSQPDKLRAEFEELLTSDYVRLDFPFGAHAHAERLPPIHRDPFDRMLLAHAVDGGMTLVTADAVVRRYPVPTFW